jgi:hypothetical protein
MFIKRYSNNGCLDLRPMIFGNSWAAIIVIIDKIK